MSSNDKTVGTASISYTNVGRNAACPCGSGKRFKHCHGATSKIDHNITSEQQLPDALYCTVDGWYYRLQSGQHLFAARKTGSKTLLLDNSLQLLVGMSRFDSLDEQINTCALKHGVNRYDSSILGLKQFSQYFMQRGLLQSSGEVLLRLKKRPTVKDITKPKFAGIGIRTCEAPDCLQSQLMSLVRRKTKWGASDPIYIFDDSTSNSAQQQNRELTKRFSKDLTVHYMGLDWQGDFVDRIDNALPGSRDVLEAMLLPRPEVLFSAGRLTNLMTLFFAGKQFLMFDDDRLLDESRSFTVDINNNIAFGQSCEWSFKGFECSADVEQSGVVMDGDPLDRHKAALGLNLFDFLEMNPQYLLTEKSVAGLTSRQVVSYQAGSIIMSTGNGLFGSPGKRDARFLFVQNYTRTQAPWHKDVKDKDKDQGYQYLLNGGYCWEVATQLSVRDYTGATPTGVDVSRFLPPTISVARSEDTLQQLMTRLLYPDSVHIEFPWVLAHRRTVKNWRNDTFSNPPEFGLGEFICILAGEQQEVENIPVLEKVEVLAQGLLNVANLNDHDFSSKILSCWLKAGAARLRKMKQCRETIDKVNVEVLKDIDNIIENDIGHFSRIQLNFLMDARGSDFKTQSQSLKQDLADYALALAAWPKIWQVCSELPATHSNNSQITS